MKQVFILGLTAVWLLATPLASAGPLVFGPQQFTIEVGRDLKQVVTFEVVDPEGNYWLQVANGEGVPKIGGEEGAIQVINLVDGGRILLNGDAVAKPPDFNHRRTKAFGFSKDVTLQPVNTLEIDLRGEVGSFITLQIRKAEPNRTISNKARDLSGGNKGDLIHLVWADDENATEYIIFRGFSTKGPWEEIGRRPQDRPNAVDLTPDARLRDLCYRIEAVDAAGRVVRRYEAVCVPQFVEEQRQGLNTDTAPARSDDINTAFQSAQSTASGPPINQLCLDNEELTDVDLMSLQEIKAFLETNNSFLKDQIQDVDGVEINPAEEVFKAAQQLPLNPQVLLTLLEREQSAITTAARLDDRQLQRIMAWDLKNRVVPLANKSIREQIKDGAAQLRRDFDRLILGESTIGGWRVGVEKHTIDGILVTPATAASATLYTYDPEVGQAWGGGKGVGGNSLFCKLWEGFGFGRPKPLVLSPQSPTLACPDGSVTFTASGGRLPYAWSTTKGVMTPGADTKSAVLTPPDNNPAIGGIAYYSVVAETFATGVGLEAHQHFCDGGAPSSCFGNLPKDGGCTKDAFDFENTCFFHFGAAGRDCPSFTLCGGMQAVCDQRTPQMVEAGCRPCGLEMQGEATVILTDARAAFVSTTVTVQ